MAVDVKRERDARVPETVADDLHVDTSSEEVCRVAVSQIVEADTRRTRFELGFARFPARRHEPIEGLTHRVRMPTFTGDGVIVRPKATDTRLDALEQAVLDLRVGASYAEAELFVMNPGDWSKVRREKDTQGRYLVNPDPSQADALRLWGVPVVVTSAQPAGTVLVLAPSLGIEAFIRESLNIRLGWVADDFQRNANTLVCEERLTMALTRPSCEVKVTGF